MAKAYAIRRYTIDPVVSTAIRPPFMCRNVTVLQEDTANAAWFYTTEGDTATRKQIPASGELRLSTEFPWDPVDSIGYVISVSGTGPLVVEFGAA